MALKLQREVKNLKRQAYIKSSAAVLRWNLDLSSFITDESTSLPFAKLIFPRCSTAATTRNIASCKRKCRLIKCIPSKTIQYFKGADFKTCSCSMMPTVSIAFLVTRYSSASLIPSTLMQDD
jgi:succinylglutamate desuccinylase